MYHKNLINNLHWLFIPITLTCSSVHSQDISDRYANVTDRVKQINNDNTFDIVVLENEEFMTEMTDGGGKLTGYFKGGQIQKMTSVIGLSYGIVTFDYYFSSGKLIFIYETMDAFPYLRNSGTFDYTETYRNFIGRYYFSDNRLVDSETTGHNRFENDAVDIETTLVREMTQYLNKLAMKR